MFFKCPNISIETETVRHWSSWSHWSFVFDPQRQERSRVCCSESCSGEKVAYRDAELGERFASFPLCLTILMTNAFHSLSDCQKPSPESYRRSAQRHNFFLDAKVRVNGTCVYSFVGARRSVRHSSRIFYNIIYSITIIDAKRTDR